MSVFSFISIGYRFIDLSSSTIEKFANLLLKAAMRKIFKIKKFSDTLLVPYLSVNVLTKFHVKPSYLHTLLKGFSRKTSARFCLVKI